MACPLRCSPDTRSGQNPLTTDRAAAVALDHGLEWRETRRSDWSITRGDPLSLSGREHYAALRHRNGIETEEIATAELTATADEWLVKTAIEARENGQEVLTKSWSFRIPRDHM